MSFDEERDFLATQRSNLITQYDFDKNFDEISNSFYGKKILVIGGAGSIGSSFIYELVGFLPEELHIVDPNENGLTNLVRNLRSKNSKISKTKLKTSPLDFGSKIFELFIKENGPYDYVFNFAAIKHVRSEKDIYSLIQMFDTNVIKHSNLLNFLYNNQLTKNYFAVSTDKAANPVSLMGASKKIMELILNGEHYDSKININTSTTRFANVAFSNGSLLQSFTTRFLKKEPLVSPKNIKRYFVSHKEAAQICILSGALLSNGQILIPKISNSFKIYPIEDVATNFVRDKGFTPIKTNNKDEAYKVLNKNNNEYPIVITEPDTSGEKDYEEFIGKNEKLISSSFKNFDVVNNDTLKVNELKNFINDFNSTLNGELEVSKTDLIEKVKNLVNNLNHIDTGKNLDNRM